MLKAKTYPAGGTLTGSAINKTVLFIKGSSLPTGLPRVLIILTDGGSYDDVIAASNYARNNGISIIAVGIGANVNQAQLL
jgi:FAD/FMN-containing dehydrogenase